MSMKQVMKMTLVVALALLALTLAATSAIAGNSPMSGERVIGPPIEGVAVVLSDGSATFVGMCKKQPVLLAFQYPGDIRTLVEAQLMYVRLGPAAPAGCFSDLGGENLMITGVQKFANFNPPPPFSIVSFPAIGAELQISVVENK